MNKINPSLRISELDALRGIAAMAVIFFHFTSSIAKNWSFHLYDPPFQFWYGDKGVDLFFMISGFVIFMTLDRARSAASFAVGRFSRLFPTFWACALITLLVTPLRALFNWPRALLVRRMLGLTTLAYVWAVMAKKALDEDSAFARTKLKTARYFFQNVLPESESLVSLIRAGKANMMAFDAEELDVA